MLTRWRGTALLVAICMVASLTVSGALSQQAWLAGEHVTPEQVALHALYESLGIHDHHSHGQAAPADDSDPDVILDAIVTIPGPAFTIAVPAGTVDFGQAPATVAARRLDGESLLTTLHRVGLSDDARPLQADFLAADPPPRRAA